MPEISNGVKQPTYRFPPGYYQKTYKFIPLRQVRSSAAAPSQGAPPAQQAFPVTVPARAFQPVGASAASSSEGWRPQLRPVEHPVQPIPNLTRARLRSSLDWGSVHTSTTTPRSLTRSDALAAMHLCDATQLRQPHSVLLDLANMIRSSGIHTWKLAHHPRPLASDEFSGEPNPHGGGRRRPRVRCPSCKPATAALRGHFSFVGPVAGLSAVKLQSQHVQVTPVELQVMHPIFFQCTRSYVAAPPVTSQDFDHNGVFHSRAQACCSSKTFRVGESVGGH